MTTETIYLTDKNIAINIVDGMIQAGRPATAVTPANQASTNDFADVAGSTLDTLNNIAVSYTCKNVLNDTICWKVLGANASDFSDAVEVQASADLVLDAIGSYSASVAVWRYYKVQIESKVDDTPGTAQVRGVTKG